MEKPRILSDSDENREKVQSYFDDAERSLKHAEIPMTPRQKMITETVLNGLPKFLKNYGVEASFPAARVLLMDSEKLTDEERGQYQLAGFYSNVERIIRIFKENADSDIKLIMMLAHEMMHAASFQSYHVQYETPHTELNERRAGITMTVEDEGGEMSSYFNDLNEGVTERLAERFIASIIENTDSKIKIPTLEGDFQSLNRVKEKAMLDWLIDGIFERNPEQFKSKDEVFQLFVESMFKGTSLPLARIIEKTYGKGWFRLLGGMTKGQL